MDIDLFQIINTFRSPSEKSSNRLLYLIFIDNAWEIIVFLHLHHKAIDLFTNYVKKFVQETSQVA